MPVFRLFRRARSWASVFVVVLVVASLAGCGHASDARLVPAAYGNASCAAADAYLVAQAYGAAAEAYIECSAEYAVPDLARLYALNQVAYAYSAAYDPQAARPFALAAEALASTLTDLPLVVRADLAFNRGRLAFLEHDLVAAIPELHWALMRYQAAYPDGHLRIHQVLTTLALVQFEYRPVVDSLAHYADRAFRYLQRDSVYLPYAAECYYAKAAAGLYDRAHERGDHYCKAVITTLDELPEPSAVLRGRTLALLGNMVKKRGDIAKGGQNPSPPAAMIYYYRADSLMEAAVELLRAHDSDYWQEAYRDWTVMSSRLPDGERLSANRITEGRKLLGERPDHYLFPARLEAYRAVKAEPADADKIVRLYENFLSEHEKRSRPNFQLLDETYYFLRENYRTLKKYERAIYYQRQGQVLFECVTDTSAAAQTAAQARLDTWSTSCLNGLSALARVDLDRYRDLGQVKYLKSAVAYYDSLDKYWLGSIVHGDEDAVLSYFSNTGNLIYSQALESNYELWRVTRNDAYLDRCFHYAERMKSFLTYREHVGAITGHPSVRRLQADILELQDKFDRQGLSQRRQSELFRLQDTLERTLILWRRDSVAYQQAHQQPTPTIAAVRNRLDANTALLHFTELDSFYYVAFIDARRHHMFQVAKTDSLMNALVEYRKALKAYKRVDTDTVRIYQHAARVIYRSFITPIDRYLPSGGELIIVPDGNLHALPFDALLPDGRELTLPDLRDARYLLRRCALRYASSWKALDARGRLYPIDPDALNVHIWADRSLASDAKFQDLHHAAACLTDTEPHVRFASDDFLENYPGDLLHLTLHAHSSTTNRHANRLAFGPLDTLYGYVIAGVDLDARLLVLAACETAVGGYRPGEGAFHLVRSCRQAGVDEIVATLWKVQQGGTARLLTYFYNELDGSLSTPAALRAAKLRYLDLAAERPVFPGYWAGVVVW